MLNCQYTPSVLWNSLLVLLFFYVNNPLHRSITVGNFMYLCCIYLLKINTDKYGQSY